ncbi:hypothetical protein CTA1_10091 [Colletotrichum tanaceti]|uniref:Uncharacterized protein n=1 Tax=Colletotrichum tanaceti TaxID=1306861 RepID=A0A4U6WZS3_9PEZI|nr:hypothetical protein CTA1_10091 [Colletotrichum tanaceti]
MTLSSSWQQTGGDTTLQTSDARGEAQETVVRSQEDNLPVCREEEEERFNTDSISSSQAEGLTTQQIIDVVNSMEWEDNEWMSFTTIQDEV